MRLDTHLHVMSKEFHGRSASDYDALLEDLAKCGLDGGWISSLDSLLTRDGAEHRRANDALAGAAQRFPGRLMGLCTVDPGEGEGAAREIERCINELGLIGVKLHPWLQGFSVTHPGMTPIMEAAGALGVPVLFHDGTPPYSSPHQIGWLAGRHPEVRVILGHAGLSEYWRDAIQVAKENENVWLQPTASCVAPIREAARCLGPERILFGSDGGYGTYRFIEYCVEKFTAALGKDTFEMIVSRNPAKLTRGR